jgi:hypothetical protein
MEPANKPTSPRVNRRSSRRLALSNLTKVECRKGTLGLGTDLNVATLDISETGVRLVLKAGLEPGQQVEVLLKGGWTCKPVKRLARVIWALLLETGNWCVGFQFDKPLPYGDMQRLAKPIR